MDEYIVGCYAGLPRVHELAPGDTLARDLQFCGFGDNDGALAAQFEGNGDEIFRRGAHDDLAHLNAASEEDLVKAAVQQLVVVLDSAVRAEDKLGREAVRDELFDDSGGVRRELGWAQNGAVSRRDRRNERCDQKLEGIIEGAHDKHAAVGLFFNAAFRGKDVHGRLFPDRLHPCLEMLQGMRDLGEYKPDLRGIAFLRMFPEVFGKRALELRLSGQDGVSELKKSGSSEFEGKRMVFGKILFLFS